MVAWWTWPGKVLALSYDAVSTVVPHFILPTTGDFRINSFGLTCIQLHRSKATPLNCIQKHPGSQCEPWCMDVNTIHLAETLERASRCCILIYSSRNDPGAFTIASALSHCCNRLENTKIMGETFCIKREVVNQWRKRYSEFLLLICRCHRLNSTVTHACLICVNAPKSGSQSKKETAFPSWASFLTFGVLKANSMFQR